MSRTLGPPGAVPAGFTRARLALLTLLFIVANLLWQSGPYMQAKTWKTHLSTGEANAAPYVAIAFGGWQWCVYGALTFWLTGRPELLVLVGGCLPVTFLGVYYLVVFMQHCRRPPAVCSLARYTAAASFLILMQTTAIAVSPARALLLVRMVCGLFTLAGAMILAVAAVQLAHPRGDGPLLAPAALKGFLCSVVWCVCGILLADSLVLGSGSAVGGACVVIVTVRSWRTFNASGGSALNKEAPTKEVLWSGPANSDPVEVKPVVRAARLAASKRMALLHAKGSARAAPPVGPVAGSASGGRGDL